MVKNPSANARDVGSIPDPGRSPGEGNSPFQYSCLGKYMDRGVGQATVHGVNLTTTTKSVLLSTTLGHAWVRKVNEISPLQRL